MAFDRTVFACAKPMRAATAFADAADHRGHFYLLRAGCPWQLFPNRFPPWRTVYRWFCTLRDDGIFENLNHHLVKMDRAWTGREPMPSAAAIDSLSVKTTESGGPHGSGAGKKIMVRKRHAMVDTDDRTLELMVHGADMEDRNGAVPLLRQSRRRHPLVEHAYADSAYNSDWVRAATFITIKIVRKFADQTGFFVHPRRWVVERTFAWLNRNRRLVKDFERTITSATALLHAAAAIVLIKRIARYA